MNLLHSVVSLVLVCMLAACSLYDLPSNEAKATVTLEIPKSLYQRITAEQAKEKMDAGEPFLLLDVRTDEEFLERRIHGAILIPDYEIKDRVESELPDKNALILIYCRSGRRSANTAREMIEMGYSNVVDFGGIIDWPYETVTGLDNGGN